MPGSWNLRRSICEYDVQAGRGEPDWLRGSILGVIRSRLHSIAILSAIQWYLQYGALLITENSVAETPQGCSGFSDFQTCKLWKSVVCQHVKLEVPITTRKCCGDDRWPISWVLACSGTGSACGCMRPGYEKVPRELCRGLVVGRPKGNGMLRF